MPALVVPGGADHRDHVAEVRLRVDGRLHRRRGQPVVGVSHHQRVHLQQPQRVHDRGVRVAADHDPQPATGRRVAEPPLAGLPGHRERRQVAGRAAGDEAAARAGRHAGLVGDQPQHGVLGRDRAGRLQPGDALDRGAGDEHVEQQAGLGRRGRDEAEEPGAVGGDDARRDHRGVHARAPRPATGRGRGSPRPARGRGRRPIGCPCPAAPGPSAAGSRRRRARCAPSARSSGPPHASGQSLFRVVSRWTSRRARAARDASA